MAYPTNYRYTKEHEWIVVDGKIGTIGITDYAQNSLGDIVYVDAPKVGDEVTANATFGSVESVKFVNPHGSLTLAVKGADGTSTNWVFTLGSATALAARGVGRTGPNALHAGDMIKVLFIPLTNRSTDAINPFADTNRPAGHRSARRYHFADVAGSDARNT